VSLPLPKTARFDRDACLTGAQRRVGRGRRGWVAL